MLSSFFLFIPTLPSTLRNPTALKIPQRSNRSTTGPGETSLIRNNQTNDVFRIHKAMSKRFMALRGFNFRSSWVFYIVSNFMNHSSTTSLIYDNLNSFLKIRITSLKFFWKELRNNLKKVWRKFCLKNFKCIFM